MTPIKITEEDRHYAKHMAEEILKELHSSINSQRALFNTNEIENRFIGFLGESILRRHLLSKGIPHEYAGKINHNKGDEYDFLVSGKRWDVKTNKKIHRGPELPLGFEILIHPKQVGKHAEYYFWILIEGNPYQSDIAYLVGGLNAAKIENYPIVEKIKGIPAITIPINHLLPVSICEDLMRGY